MSTPMVGKGRKQKYDFLGKNNFLNFFYKLKTKPMKRGNGNKMIAHNIHDS